MKKSLLLLAALSLLVTPWALAADLSKPAGWVKHPWVNDFAGVIDANHKAQLSALSHQLEKASGIEMTMVTVPSLEGEDIEGYAVKLFEKWGIGKKGKNNGLLLLAAIHDRTARVEVGYGLEEVVNDAYAGRILREVLFPYFKKGEYGEGFLQAAQVLVTRLSDHYQFTLEGVPVSHLGEAEDLALSPGAKVLTFLLILLLAFLVLRYPWLLFFFIGRGGGGGRGSDSGGGFGGFGGGSSGGGGASGRW
ncbi:MAG: TPM domain-containing protein [Deltaproteobacteria bacterium]|nr:TPM domain-containing protein [Deltaproteobacteria bacterium]